MTLAEEKRALRAHAAAHRENLHRRADEGAAPAALAHFRTHIDLAAGGALSAYLPVRAEFDPLPVLRYAHSRGCPTCLPVVLGRGRPLSFRRWAPGEPLVEGTFGIAVPPPEAGTLDPAILIVPLLAFDDEGYRLGYGGGFYDRTLAHCRARTPGTLAVGVAFAGQRIDRIPRSAEDERLDWIVTEEGARRFERR